MRPDGGTADLFASAEPTGTQEIGPDALILRNFVASGDTVLEAIEAIETRAPWRRMVTPGGRPMSVAMTNCGQAGWVSDSRGYRYSGVDPLSGEPWPPMPSRFVDLAAAAAAAAGFAEFVPDACLLNRYEPGARLSLHQDADERDFTAPIVSVSLGLPAIFLFGGARRSDRPQRYSLHHGDVVVWGRRSRRFYHGIAPLADGLHPQAGRLRINLTLRKAL
jgi:DNA oxidative demethylase